MLKLFGLINYIIRKYVINDEKLLLLRYVKFIKIL